MAWPRTAVRRAALLLARPRSSTPPRSPLNRAHSPRLPGPAAADTARRIGALPPATERPALRRHSVSGSHSDLGEQPTDAMFDLISDGAYRGDVFTCRFVD